MADHGALDFAGGTVVHVSAGVSALVAALVIGREIMSNTQMKLIMSRLFFWVLLLWFGGLVLMLDLLWQQMRSQQTFVTTTIAASAALCVWAILEIFTEQKVSATGAAIGAVVGLVTITPAAGFVTPMGASPWEHLVHYQVLVR